MADPSRERLMEAIDDIDLEIHLEEIYVGNGRDGIRIGGFNVALTVQVPFAGIVGPSGSGKTTFYKSFFKHFVELWQAEDPGSRVVEKHRLNRIPLSRVPHIIGYAAQRPFFLPFESVRANLVAPLKWQNRESPPQEEVDRVIGHCNLSACLDKRIPVLSAGELQRLNLARMLLTAPKVGLIDECLTALDEESSRILLTNLHHHYAEHCRFLIITHRLADLECVPHRKVLFRQESEHRTDSRGSLKNTFVQVV